MNKIFYFFLLICSIFIIFENDTFDSLNFQNKIVISKENNFSYCLNVIPSDNEFDFLKYYDIIDFIYKEPKPQLSIIITNLSDNKIYRWKIFKAIVDYAFHKNVFIWISTIIQTDLEYEFYMKALELNYTNVGITISTYNKNLNDKVDDILSKNGNIRLVKGYYYGDIKDWDIVTENFKINAIKLINSDNYHILATHDFELLDKLKKHEKFKNIELNFFYNSINYVLLNSVNFTNNKTFEISYGNNLNYFINNLFILDLKNILSRKIKYLKYYF